MNNYLNSRIVTTFTLLVVANVLNRALTRISNLLLATEKLRDCIVEASNEHIVTVVIKGP